MVRQIPKDENSSRPKKSESGTPGPYDLNSENWIKILKLYFDEPTVKLHISEVARRTGLTPRGAQYILNSLRNDGLLHNESNGIVNNYWGNYDNEKFMGLKRSLNLNSLYSSGLISTLESFYNNPRCIVLFGSYARGEDTLNSDIDIAIETFQGDYPDLRQFEEQLKRPISIHLIEDVKKENANFINSLANGIILSGYLNVV
ncbi:nucleotidyltransferase domain-containing protein [Methanocella sp. MCL-LM]|uniref:nucleotidyltransferase domain-containing protein n=1 Tax=Methanocella sp. MCL-LM TaxID=3412035 RepID=UPI003C774AA1